MSNIVEVFNYKDLHKIIGSNLDVVVGITDITPNNVNNSEYKNMKIAIKKFLLTKSKEYSHVKFVFMEIKTKEILEQITKLFNFTEIMYPKIIYIHDKTKALVETSPDAQSMYIVFRNCMEHFYKEPPQYYEEENTQETNEIINEETKQQKNDVKFEEKLEYLNKKYKEIKENYLKNIVKRKKIEKSDSSDSASSNKETSENSGSENS